MATTIQIPENAIVDMLKNLPENILADIFWKTFVTPDDLPLTESEKLSVDKAKKEFNKRETVKWQAIR
ncbi:MAG: hypothetical protein ACLQQ4_10620 [Bacteroidia bacterium]